MKNKEYIGRWLNTLRLMKRLKKHYPLMTSATVFGVLQHLFTIAAAALGAYMVGLAVNGTLLPHAKAYLIILGTLIVFRAVSSYLESYLYHKAGYTILAEFRIDLYNSVERISPQLFLNMRSGQLASTLMSDVEVLEWFYAHTFGSIIIAGIVPAIVLIYMGSMNVWLSVVMLPFLAVTAAIPFIMKKKADEQGKLVRDRLADANAVTVEGIHGMKEILMLNYQEKYRQKNEAYLDKLYESQIQYGKRLGIEGGLIDVSVGFAMIGIAILSIFLIFAGKIGSEWYPTIILLSIMIFNPVIIVSNMARNFGLITAAADRVFRIMEAKPTVADNGEPCDISKLKKSVRFENVGFKYKDERDYAVKDVSFQIEPGEMVALVGHSGAGKSTCVNLLLRYWDVNEGSVGIGGKDIREMTLDNLRSLTSAVLQEVYLFNISIRENIRLGKTDATDDEVEAAAKLALAHDFIVCLSDGYETNVGERGTQLSGGQRQRIAIARALLKDSPILILDEAVSALDTENEHELQKAFKEVYKNRTTLVVAHRLSTIMNADRLIVMDNGQIVQSGTHKELLAQDGLYKELVAYQFSDKRRENL
ncbi:MAG: ABC transporter ATP-binding protein [Peptococcaceae bacterium]